MAVSSSNKQARRYYLLRIMLAVVLVIAAWHVASHDVDLSGDLDSDENCQVCRLSHVPIIDLPILAWLIPVLVLSLRWLAPIFQQTIQSYRYASGARAPPLF